VGLAVREEDPVDAELPVARALPVAVVRAVRPLLPPLGVQAQQALDTVEAFASYTLETPTVVTKHR
jgi:hypothetical protein